VILTCSFQSEEVKVLSWQIFIRPSIQCRHHHSSAHAKNPFDLRAHTHKSQDISAENSMIGSLNVKGQGPWVEGNERSEVLHPDRGVE